MIDNATTGLMEGTDRADTPAGARGGSAPGDRRRSIATGVLFLITHVTSIAAVLLYGAGGTDANAALAGRVPVLAGGLLEVILAAAVVGTSVALYPMVARYAPGLAAGYVALRTLEAAVIAAGVMVILPLAGDPGTAAAPLLGDGASHALQSAHAWSFLIGPGLICPINTVVLAWALWRNRLVPSVIPALGLVGGPLIAVTNLTAMFAVGTLSPVTVIPIFAWEISLAIYLIVKGLRAPYAPAQG